MKVIKINRLEVLTSLLRREHLRVNHNKSILSLQDSSKFKSMTTKKSEVFLISTIISLMQNVISRALSDFMKK
jgi:hypothetical protein